MNEVAKYNEGNWYLVHSWYVDDFGFKRNSFELYTIKEDGTKVIYPFFAPLRIHNYDKNSEFGGDDITPYQTFEYAEMLREQVNKLNQ